MYQVLTIDFDIIMGPSIQLYNDIIGDNKGIDKVIKQYPLLEYTLTGDMFVYEALTRELMKLYRQLTPSDIYFTREHQTAVRILEPLEKFKLYNIDHHHDLGYNRTMPTSKIIRPECGNWVKYLYDKGKIEKYIWICNNNSDFPSNGLGKLYLEDSVEIRETDFSLIGKVDKLIICNSPQWIPPNIQALYMTWVGIAEEYFCEDFKILQA